MKAAIIGDIMVDCDLHCSCERICQEGPWPVFKIEREERRLGGAGNVAVMLNALGCESMLLGNDVNGSSQYSINALDRRRLRSWGEVLTTKTRFVINGQLVGPRIDRDIQSETGRMGIEFFRDRIQAFNPDAIIIADHGKGVVTPELMTMLCYLKIPLFIDPISTTCIPSGSHPHVIAGALSEMPWATFKKEYGQRVTIEKLGQGGLRYWIYEKNGPMGKIPSACQNLLDPLGAGDQLIAALAYKRCLGADWPESIEWANVAAGMQCERRGCVPVTVAEVEERTTESQVPANLKS